MSARRLGIDDVLMVLIQMQKRGHDTMEIFCDLVGDRDLRRRRWYLYRGEPQSFIGSPRRKDEVAGIALVPIPHQLDISFVDKKMVLTWEGPEVERPEPVPLVFEVGGHDIPKVKH